MKRQPTTINWLLSKINDFESRFDSENVAWVLRDYDVFSINETEEMEQLTKDTFRNPEGVKELF